MEEKILGIVRNAPGIRTMQLADQLDMDIEAIERLLLGLVDAGKLTSHQVEAPNGRKATGYTLVSVELPAPAAADATLSYAKRAAIFIEANGGQATTAQLAGELRIDSGAVNAHLGSGLKSGRLLRTDGVWTVGAPKKAAGPFDALAVDLKPLECPGAKPRAAPPAPPAAAAEAKPAAVIHDQGSVVRVGNVIVATRDSTLVDPALVARLANPGQEPVEGPQPSKQTPAEAVAAYIGTIPEYAVVRSAAQDAFRCCMWSDGVLELQVGGRTVLELDGAEQQQLIDTLASRV